jgi:hypothetical protein
MAHYALINPSGMTVVQVFVGKDETDLTHDWEQYYAPEGMVVRQTSYNTHGGVHALGGTPLRKNYAGIGYTYDEARDAFIPPQPSPDCVLDEDTCLWVCPPPEPESVD